MLDIANIVLSSLIDLHRTKKLSSYICAFRKSV
jgi:hypothetical protein